MNLKLNELSVWQKCLKKLKVDVPSPQFDMWIGPLQAECNSGKLTLLAPNKYVLENVACNFLNKIGEVLGEISNDENFNIELKLIAESGIFIDQPSHEDKKIHQSFLNPNFTFDTFIEGKSNQFAKAAAIKVSESAGESYNPLFIYGGVGLGKTHLMQAVGSLMVERDPTFKVLYLHSERFVGDMVRAIKLNKINEFKEFYRSIQMLLIDDIQFFAGKDRSQEEFFHTFNALLDARRQIILTCDKYPKEIEGLEERLKSRFGWGLTVAIEPPELETRVAILISKAEQSNVDLPHEVAFFIAKNIQANVRELEGALKRVVANSHFVGRPITLELAKEALRDLLALQAKLVTIENIQKTIAQYYKLKLIDLLGKSRSRTIVRPRQMAMALAKELTNHSLPEIGKAFGDRDHTTVLHACQKVKELIALSVEFAEDHRNLIRILST